MRTPAPDHPLNDPVPSCSLSDLRRPGRLLLVAALLVLAAGFWSTDARAAQDERFFGEYCGDHQVRVTTTVRFLGIRIARRTDTFNFEVQARLNHVEDRTRRGLMEGRGLVTGEGRRISFAVSGHITAEGVAEGTLSAPELGPVDGRAYLDATGDRLVVLGGGQRVVLRKSACPNRAPTARILAPAPGDIPWGGTVDFRGTASDPEDPAMAPQRMVWASSRDGFLGRGLTLRRGYLSHGEHIITFTATDSGGRAATDTVTVRIANNAPNPPRILRPGSGARLVAGIPTVLRGSATDRESGPLRDEQLVWTSDRDGPLGTGEAASTALSAGSHRITLTATDDGGDSSNASVRVEVLERGTGNAPPSVRIVTPTDYIGIADFDCLILTARGEDLEDGPLTGAALTWTDSYVDATGATITRTLPETGEAVELCTPATTGRDTVHTLTVTPTDSDGLAGEPDFIRVYVIPGGLI